MHALLIIFKLLLLFVITVHGDGFDATLGHLKAQTSEGTQVNAALDLIKRIIPDRASEFNVVINKNLAPVGKDAFHLQKTSENIIKITASSGVAAAWGFHYYLKHFCKAHISWEATQLNLPDVLPMVHLKIVSNDRFRYYQNVCTTSYSFVWWSWKDWEKHIDWMAMNSINLALAFNGQEAIWKRVYKKFGLIDNEINEHFAGPAFLSWSRMGNMRGFGGPLSDAWHARSLLLQKLILKRMRDLGIIPVLPAFAGQVPRGFKRLFSDAKFIEMTPWNNFEDKYCCPYLLDPTDPLFNTIGITFMQEQIAEFGTDHIYNCDTFNEMIPTNGNTSFLSSVSKSIYSAMTDVDSQAIWVMQNWLFVHDFLFWTRERIKALLTSIPKGRMIVLDLQSEQFPQYTRLQSYFGQPFIWCMLHNFGGTLGMFGSAGIINTEILKARNFKDSTMIGTGLTMEGINQNYVIYDLMTEAAWLKKPVNLTKWFTSYATRRYGQENENATKAWHILQDTIYNFNTTKRMRGKYVITSSPRLVIKPWFWYNITEFMEAWDYLLMASDQLKRNPGYRHDVVDCTRQALQIIGDVYYMDLVKAFKGKKVQDFQSVQKLFIQLFEDLDLILATNEAFLLGRWLEAAKSHAVTDQEFSLYEFNARNQITLWGPRGEIKDYANKQWAGVVSNFFGPRWKLFMSAMNYSLVSRQPFNVTRTSERVFTEIEAPFTMDTTVFPTEATGDSIEIARSIHTRWRNRTRTLAPRTRKRSRDRVQRSSKEIEEPLVINL